MKTKLKGNFIWIFSISCIVFGLLVAFIAMLIVGFDMNRLNTDGEWQERRIVQPLGDINEVNIEVRNRAIEVRAGSGNEIVIIYHENDNVTFTETITNNMVSLVQGRNRRFVGNMQFFTVGIQIGPGPLVVEIPAEALLTGRFRTTNGRVDIGQSGFTNLQINSSNGRIYLDRVTVANQTTMRTSNGLVTLTESTFGDSLDITSTNGRINLADVELERNVNIRTSNGNINLTNVDGAGDMVTRTTNGRVELVDVTTTGNLSLTSSNGHISLVDTVFHDGKIVTSNGRVTVNNLRDHQEYRFVTRTSNARTTIGELNLGSGSNNFGDGERLLEVRTSNGAIEITFD